MEDKQSAASPTPRPEQLSNSTGGSLEQLNASSQSLDTPVTVAERGPQGVVSQPTMQKQSWLAGSWKKLAIAGLSLLVVLGGTAIFLGSRNQLPKGVKADDFASQKVSLSEFSATQPVIDAQTLTVNGRLQVTKTLVISPTVQPQSGVAGQIYYDQSTNQLSYFNGTEFLNLVNSPAPLTINNTFLQNTTSVTNLFQGAEGATVGITTPNGTTGTLLKFTSAQTAGDSIVQDKNTFINVNGGINITAATDISNLRFWTNSTVPTNPNIIDTEGPVELGMKFNTDVSGVVNGVRFYKGTTSTGPYIGSLWTNTGSLLAQATFSTTATGWQTVNFSAPVPISPDTTYIVSYHSMGGGYAADPGYFGATGVDNGPIHALASGIDGANGIFRYAATPTFPNQGFNSTNYWVDIDFSGATYTPDSRIRVNNAQISSSDLANDTNIAKRTSSQIFSGYNTFRPTNNAADAFSVQRADTTPILTVDTSGMQIVLGRGVGDATGTILVLGKRVAVGDPSGAEGAIYYNNAQQSFRCYRNGTWENCAQPEVDRSFSVYEEFLGGQNTSFAADSFGSMNWHAAAIGANGSVSFNPASPTPVGDRPGVLAVQTPAVINQGTTFLLGSNGGSMILATNNIIKTAVAVSSTTQVLRVGLHSQTTGSARPVSGVWWEADPSVNANWQYCSGDGTTATCTATTVAIAADTWVRLELRVTGTGTGTSSFTAGINGAFAARTLITIDTTNRISPAFSCLTTTAAAQSCYWDYYQLKGTTGAAR